MEGKCCWFSSPGADRLLPLILWRRVNKMSNAAASLRRERGKWKCGGEPSRAKSHQCVHVVLIERGGGRKSKGRENTETGEDEAALLPSFPPSQPLTPLREFSQMGKISADDTVVKMKTPQRSVDVTVIDS